MSKQTLAVMEETFTIHSFDVSDVIPQAVYQSDIFFIAKTYDEISVVCPSHIAIDSIEQEPNWAALEVLGPLGFSMTGILSNISGVLADAKISIFAISTFETDYILLKKDHISDARAHLMNAGYKVVNA